MILEQALRDAAASGRLSGLTLWPCAGGWQANARPENAAGWRVVTDRDPVAALLGALAAPTEPPSPPSIFD